MNNQNTNYPFNHYVYEFSSDYDNDLSYLAFLYPKESLLIKNFIDNELDKYEYESSVIFHEYPDKIRIESIINNIYLSMNEKESLKDNKYSPEILQTIFYYELISRRRRYKLIKNEYFSNSPS